MCVFFVCMFNWQRVWVQFCGFFMDLTALMVEDMADVPCASSIYETEMAEGLW